MRKKYRKYDKEQLRHIKNVGKELDRNRRKRRIPRHRQIHKANMELIGYWLKERSRDV